MNWYISKCLHPGKVENYFAQNFFNSHTFSICEDLHWKYVLCVLTYLLNKMSLISFLCVCFAFKVIISQIVPYFLRWNTKTQSASISLHLISKYRNYTVLLIMSNFNRYSKNRNCRKKDIFFFLNVISKSYWLYNVYFLLEYYY